MRTFAIIAALACLTGASALYAQDAGPDSLTIAAATHVLKSDLRNYVTAQETYFADHGTYARTLAVMQTMYRPSRDVTLVLLTASDTGHSEIATNATVPGLVCAMYVGSAPPPLGRGDEGEVVCNGP